MANPDSYVCWACVGEDLVQGQIKDSGRPGKCDFCSRRRKAVIPLMDLASIVDEAFRRNFHRAEEEPVISAESDKVYWEMGGELVEYLIRDTLLVEPELAEALVRTLRDHFSDDADGYDYSDEELQLDAIEPHAGWYSYIWEDFTARIKHVGRFFDDEAAGLLKQILWPVSEYRSAKGNSPIRILSPDGPDSLIYRAREAHSSEHLLHICLDPSRQLRPPPPQRAVPGRMNPAGIPVFYGALDVKTCVSEIRLPVGGIAAVGAFQLLRPVTVLDLTVFDEGPEYMSYFRRDRAEILSHLMFLTDFHREVRKPVLPRDEALDYIPTQVVADYLAHQNDPKFDGLIYSSALTSRPGHNVVLFSHVAVVGPPADSERSAEQTPRYPNSLEDGTFIIEESHQDDESAQMEGSSEAGRYPVIDLSRSGDIDQPEPVLRYVEGSVEVHRVTSISHATEEIHVLRLDTRRRESQTRSRP